jgi:hypothetical protein
VHLSILGVREGKEGWFHLVCPGGPCCVDDGDLFSSLVRLKNFYAKTDFAITVIVFSSKHCFIVVAGVRNFYNH